MNAKNSAMGGRFWVHWLFLTAAGYSIGYLVGFILGHFLLGNLMIGIGIGAGVGFMQSLAVRHLAVRPGPWVLTTVGGLSVAVGLYAAASAISGYPFDLSWPSGVLGWAIALAAGGTLVGIVQQRILRLHGARAACWIAANQAGWCLSALGLAIPADMNGELTSVAAVILRNGLLAPAVAGAILGAVTGGALIWMLRQPVRQEPSTDAQWSV